MLTPLRDLEKIWKSRPDDKTAFLCTPLAKKIIEQVRFTNGAEYSALINRCLSVPGADFASFRRAFILLELADVLKVHRNGKVHFNAEALKAFA